MDLETPLATGAKTTIPAKRRVKSATKRVQVTEPAASGRRFGFVIAVTLLAIVILVGPLAVGGIWDPIELRVADLAARIASALFNAQHIEVQGATTPTLPTLGELGRGELPFTSIALGFRLLGMHDWAGRLPLALWLVAALVSLVVWASRFFTMRVAGWSALVFCTMPLVFFQARFMLGDAATIGTSTLTFVLLSLACLSAPRKPPIGRAWRLICLVGGLAVAGLGVLTRGLGIAVAVPTLAVALAHAIVELPGARPRTAASRFSRLLAAGLGLVGLTSAIVAIAIASRPAPQRGVLLVLQGMSLVAPAKMPTFDTVVTQLGHGLFPWSVVLPFALAAVFGRLCRERAAQEAAAISALVLFVFMNGALQTWLVSMGATFPFPGLAALALILGVWLESPNVGVLRSRNVLLGAAAFAVMLVSDFENLPDKLLAATTAADAKLPTSFKPENLAWLRASACVVGVSFFVTALRWSGAKRAPETVRNVIAAAVGYLRRALGGQLVFFALLIETSLITGAALVTATRFGLPFQRVLYMTREQRELLTWAWLLMPGLLLLGLCGLVLYSFLADFYTPGFGLPRWATLGDFRGRLANSLLVRYPRIARIQVSRGAVLRAGFFVAALLLSLGWSGRLSQQLSPRRALNRYHSLASPGEPLGLLGVRPQITQYYSRQRPEVLLDAEEAADWMLFGKEGARRWLLVKGDQFARFNAAYREKCQCSRNAPVIDGRSSELFLVSNRAMDSARNENPLQSVLLERAPNPQQKIDANFGDQVEAIGWDLVAEGGNAVAELRAGRRYELQLYFRVLSRPSVDWEIFVHIDGYGRRYNADHVPTQGAYPMSNWRPGDFVVDRETIILDPSFSEGNYELYFGFFKGSRRLDVKHGKHDDNRLLAGTIRVM
jgi:4-amino-4-deoxy-L-arabinose transferase-like glycosyltransferase